MSLDTATTDELIKELLERHTCGAFVGRPKVDRDYKWSVQAVGSSHEVLGLLALAAHSIAKKATEDI